MFCKVIRMEEYPFGNARSYTFSHELGDFDDVLSLPPASSDEEQLAFVKRVRAIGGHLPQFLARVIRIEGFGGMLILRRNGLTYSTVPPYDWGRTADY